MSDCYNIPNDNGIDYRLKKFVEYQHKVPAIHPITIMAYIKKRQLTKDDLVRIAYINSITYCEVSTLYIFEELNQYFYDKKVVQEFWKQNKGKIIFNSARKWVMHKDMFCRLIFDFNAIFGQEPYKRLQRICKYTDTQNYDLLKRYLSQIKDCGRFAQDLFMEMLLFYYKAGLIDINLCEPFELDWNKDANMTSGLLNIIYEDEKADEFDKTGKIDYETAQELYKALLKIQAEIKKKYPEQDNSLQSFMTKICSFRNLFKASRYGGYHHDRQLENIRKYQQSHPEKLDLWQEILADRKSLFSEKLLGEIGGWNGIQKQKKRLWIDKGLTGVEEYE